MTTTETRSTRRRRRSSGRPVGRPLADGVRRERRATFHVTAAEIRTYDRAATLLGKTRAALLLDAVRHYMKHIVPKRLSAEDLTWVRGEQQESRPETGE